MKKNNRDEDYSGQYPGDGLSVVGTKGSRKGGRIVLRIAFYSGLFLVIVAAVGGYYYLDCTRRALNKKVSGNPCGLVKTVGPGEERIPISPEASFIEGPSGEIRQISRPSSPTEPTRELSPVGAGGQGQVVSPEKTRKEVPYNPKTIPSSTEEKISRDNAASKPPAPLSQPETLLSDLVLREDNPFRDKFLKRFQDARVPKTSLREKGRSGRSGRVSRLSRSGGMASGPGDGELAILPDIAGGADDPGSLKVLGVIQTREASIALTNKGELRIGSMVNGDAVTGITINEVRLKSGKYFKVAGQ